MVYIDLDGVCADFHSKVLEVTGKEYKGEESWKELDKIPNLFYTLDVMHKAEEAVMWIEDYFCKWNVEFLTALPKNTGMLYSAQKDKVLWVRNKLKNDLQVNCVQHWSYKKYWVSSKEDILIDDSKRNIQEWTNAGGIGILHSNWFDTIEELKKYY